MILEIEITPELEKQLLPKISSQVIDDLKERLDDTTKRLFAYKEAEFNSKTKEQLAAEMLSNMCVNCRFHSFHDTTLCPCAKPELFRKPLLIAGEDGTLQINHENACEEFEWD